MTDVLIAHALHRAPLAPSPPRHYRNRMVYDLSAPPAAADDLAAPAVAEARRVVGLWCASRSRMPRGFWRELSVRLSSTGELQLKLLLAAGAEAQWAEESAAFAAFLSVELRGAAASVCYQLAAGRARPPKGAPSVPLHGPLHLLEQCAGRSYAVSADTLSQVNHATAAALVRQVGAWLRLHPPDEGSAPVAPRAAAAVAAAAAARGGAIVTGRDVNLFGLALLAPRGTPLRLVTHCRSAFADAALNARRMGRRHATAAWLVARGERTAALLRALAADAPHAAADALCDARWPEHGEEPPPPPPAAAPPPPPPSAPPPPSLAIVTAGRRGVGPHVCAALRALPLRALVYISCCDGSLAADAAHLLGEGGFAVASAARYDHFPRSAFRGAALLLVRRPPALLLPVGPAGSGKSTLCRALRLAAPPGGVRLVPRDALLAAERAAGASLRAARARMHARVVAAAHDAMRRGCLCVFDSCNARVGGRAAAARLAAAAAAGEEGWGGVALVSFAPGEQEAERYRAFLLERVAMRAAHPTFPVLPDEREAALDATLSAMEWPAPSELGAHVVRCDPMRPPLLIQTLSEIFAFYFWWAPAASGSSRMDWERIKADNEKLLDILRCSDSTPELELSSLVKPPHFPHGVELAISSDGAHRVKLVIRKLKRDSE
ncbi:hypothetical protein AB1Y20_021503 [Prymnesium parvum]|uniref:Uncharacterized protein n=1 Tax=Prymnesium parvum TaxID=97485 RepID=A0AB34JLS8_PRYPA